MDLIDSTVVNVAAPRSSTISSLVHLAAVDRRWLPAGDRGRPDHWADGWATWSAASGCSSSVPSGSSCASLSVRLGTEHRLPDRRPTRCKDCAGAMMLPQGFGILREVFPPTSSRKRSPSSARSSASRPCWARSSAGLLIRVESSGTRLALGLLGQRPARGRCHHRGGAPAAGIETRPADPAGPGRQRRWSAPFAMLLVYPLIQGREAGWPWWTYASMAGGVPPLGRVCSPPASAGKSKSLAPGSARASSRTAATRLAWDSRCCSSPASAGTLLCTTLFLQLGQGFSPIQCRTVHRAILRRPHHRGRTFRWRLGPKYGRLTIQAGVVVSTAGWLLLVLALRAHGQSDLWI